MSFRKYSDIGQFRAAVRSVNDLTRFIGLDDNEEPIFDNNIKLPKIVIEGTEKVHGTNACVGYSESKGLWVQSRKNIITVDKDNAGCAAFVLAHETEWKMILDRLSANIEYDEIYIYFEFCGGNIQAKTAVTGLDKRAIIFAHFKTVLNGESTWHKTKHIDAPYANIFNVKNFKVWKVEIDFNEPQMSKNTLIEITEKEVELDSPIGISMGVPGNIGEGVVWTFTYKGKLHKFKVKGIKHATSKVKRLKPVNIEFEQKKIDFANYATPSFRLEQALDELCGIAEDMIEPDIKMTGDFLRLVIKDVIKEESDILVDSGLCAKDVNSKISKIARAWFMERLY